MKAIGIVLAILVVVMVLSFIATAILDSPICIVIALICFVGMILTCMIWNHVDVKRYRYRDRDICGPEDIV
jgi:predicted tellurium resistance membrane protein TerC